MASDLSKHAMEDMERVLNRHMSIAQTVLPPADVALMLLNMSNGMAMGTAYYMLQVANDGKSVDQIWDLARSSLARLFEVAKPELLKRFDAQGRAAT